MSGCAHSSQLGPTDLAGCPTRTYHPRSALFMDIAQEGLFASHSLMEEQELAADPLGRVVEEDPQRDGTAWEKELVSKIRAMSSLEQSLLLEMVQNCIKEHSQLTRKVQGLDAGVQALLMRLDLDPMVPWDKMSLFQLYGLALRECPNVSLVRRHLSVLLDLSHKLSEQREGIALTVGLTSTLYLEEVWALLEQLGRTRFLRSAAVSPQSQQLEVDAHWRWVGSTCLLCYGQIAAHIGERLLPWVDNIACRMVYYFSCSSYDHVLKMSFLCAAIMLTKALSKEGDAKSFKFTQIPELIQCLLCILQREPGYLATLFRQKIILVIMGLSSLRPRLKPTVKSRVLQTCLWSLYTLPAPERLKGSLPPMVVVPDVMMLYQKSMQALDLLLRSFMSENESMDEICFLLQHAEPWLLSDLSHVRRRAVQSVFLLLKHVVEHLTLTEQATPSTLGHQIGLLTLLWQDTDNVTQSHSRQCVYLLLQLLIQQKAESTLEFMHLNKMKNFEARASRESEIKLYYMVKALERNLTVAQHTQLVLTLLSALCSPETTRCQLASHVLLVIVESCSIKPEQVAETLHGLVQKLPCILSKSSQEAMLRVLAMLGAQHTQDTVEVLLSLNRPMEWQVMLLWKALATSQKLARKVVTQLYVKLKLRPSRESVRSQPEELISLMALSTIYELLYVKDYQAAVRWAFAGILLGLLTQLHYLFELDMVAGMADYQEDVLETRPLGPCRTCLEALKGLFWTSNYWEVFAHLKLQKGWELFEHLETYTEGVALLARAMVYYNCEVKAVLGQAVIALKSSEERDNIVAILIVTEFLNSQEAAQYMSSKAMGHFLGLGLDNPHPLVRATSLKGLSSTQLHPKKVGLLQKQLAVLLDGFPKAKPEDLLGLMSLLGDLLHHLGHHGISAASLRMVQHLLLLFESDQADVRAAAIALYGDVLHSGGYKFQQPLKGYASQALVPLLVHLTDSCPEVVTRAKSTFLRCAILLRWEFRKELFGKLAWGRGPSAENSVFIYMMESSFGHYPQFLMQALAYLGSCHRNLKLTAMRFIGTLLQDYFTSLCFCLKKSDLKLLRKHLEILKEDPDSRCRQCYHSCVECVEELAQCVSR